LPLRHPPTDVLRSSWPQTPLQIWFPFTRKSTRPSPPPPPSAGFCGSGFFFWLEDPCAKPPFFGAVQSSATSSCGSNPRNQKHHTLPHRTKTFCAFLPVPRPSATFFHILLHCVTHFPLRRWLYVILAVAYPFSPLFSSVQFSLAALFWSVANVIFFFVYPWVVNGSDAGWTLTPPFPSFFEWFVNINYFWSVYALFLPPISRSPFSLGRTWSPPPRLSCSPCLRGYQYDVFFVAFFFVSPTFPSGV